MQQNIIHIGLDVDDTQYHGAAFNKETGEVIDFKSQPSPSRSAGKLATLPLGSSIADLLQGHQEYLCTDDDYRDW